MGLDLTEQEKLKVTSPGEAGYRGAWDASRSIEPTKDQVRDAAINRADIDELNAALDRLSIQKPDTATDEALRKIRARIDELLRGTTH